MCVWEREWGTSPITESAIQKIGKCSILVGFLSIQEKWEEINIVLYM